MELLYTLENIRTPLLDTVMGLVTNLGGEAVFIAAAIIVFWCLSKSCGYYMMTVGFAGTIINQFLKLWFRIPRPWVKDPGFTIVESARAEATGYSFPSGHTQNAFAVFGAPARYFKSTTLRIVLVLLIALTAFSRMYVGVHTPLDVGVSLIVGTVLVFVIYPFFRDMDRSPKKVYIIFGIFIVMAAAFVVFVELYDFPADIDTDNYASGLKNAYMILFCAVGLLLTFYVDTKYVRRCRPRYSAGAQGRFKGSPARAFRRSQRGSRRAVFHRYPVCRYSMADDVQILCKARKTIKISKAG